MGDWQTHPIYYQSHNKTDLPPQDVDTMLDSFWACIADYRPALNQHLIKVLCLLGEDCGMRRCLSQLVVFIIVILAN